MMATKNESSADGLIQPVGASAQAKARKLRERELERKRARGDVSCAECRRLKLKCNKKVPCGSCVRRGCHTICPNGSLASGQGTRFVLANTDKLHNKLLDMSKRIRQLEDALQIAQTTISSEPHSLLSEDLLSIKAGVDIPDEKEHVKLEESEDEDPEISAAFGTLSIMEDGETRFVGRVGSEALLVNAYYQIDEHPASIADSDVFRSLPAEICHAAEAFPLVNVYLPRDQVFALIEARLPSYERATALVEAYLENVSYFFLPVQREQIMEELLPSIYKRPQSGKAAADCENDSHADDASKTHQLALAFALFSCGAIADLTLAPQNSEAELYHHLTRAALSLQSLFDGTSLKTVQAVVLLAAYDFLACKKNTLESAWKTLSFGLVLAASIGLHRDPARWGLEARYVQRRRRVFWEIFSIDKWKSLGSGRPAVFHLTDVDCKFPEDLEVRVTEDGRIFPGRHAWKYRFAKEIIAPISEHLCLARQSKYSEILEFDRKVRDFEEHPLLRERFVEYGKLVGMRRYSSSMSPEIVLLFLHRNFFARAMLEHPANPMRSPFAPSFLAAFAASTSLLRSMRAAYDDNEQGLLRQWPIWAHTLTAGVIVGSVASRSRTSTLALAAFKELDLAVDLFEKASFHPVVKGGLPILRRLRDKALDSLQKAAGVPSSLFAVRDVEDNEEDELTILRGTARFVQGSSKGKSRSERTNSNSPASSKSDDSKSNTPSPLPTSFTATGRFASSSATPLPQKYNIPSPSIPSIFVPISQSEKAVRTGRGSEPLAASSSNDTSAMLPSQQQIGGAVLPDTELDLTAIMDFVNNNNLSSIPSNLLPSQSSIAAQLYQPAIYNDPNTSYYSLETPGQGMNVDEWSDLGFRTVLESLVSEPTQAPAALYTPDQSAASNAFQFPGELPLDSSAQSQHFGNVYDNGSHQMPNESSSNFSGYQPGMYDGHPGQGFMSTNAGVDDASLVEAWRSISDNPQFMGPGMGSKMFQ